MGAPAPTITLRGRTAPAALLVVPCFFVLNSSLNMLNRWALGIAGFRFPLLLTACHAAFSFCLMLPVVLALKRWGLYLSTLRRQWRGILTVGLFLASNIALNNLSLVYISLSLNQIIRACIPVVTALMGAALERRLPRRGELAALVVLCTGVALAIAEAAVHGNATGVLICMCGVLSGASMLLATNKVLSERLDVMQLAVFTAPITCAALLPLAAVRESAGFRDYLAGGAGGAPATAAAIILAGSAIAALYNVVHYAMVLTTSPVTTCVFGQAKIVGLLLLSAAFLGEKKEFTAKMTAGCVLAIAGFGAYSWLRMQAPPSGPAAAGAGGGRGAPGGAGAALHISAEAGTLSPPRAQPPAAAATSVSPLTHTRVRPHPRRPKEEEL